MGGISHPTRLGLCALNSHRSNLNLGVFFTYAVYTCDLLVYFKIIQSGIKCVRFMSFFSISFKFKFLNHCEGVLNILICLEAVEVGGWMECQVMTKVTLTCSGQYITQNIGK